MGSAGARGIAGGPRLLRSAQRRSRSGTRTARGPGLAGAPGGRRPAASTEVSTLKDGDSSLDDFLDGPMATTSITARLLLDYM